MFLYNDAMALIVETIVTATLMPILVRCGRSAMSSTGRGKTAAGSVARRFVVILSKLRALSVRK